MKSSSRAVADDTVLVVGSGPAGAMAAARLVERGLDVTLLDAGPRPPRGVVVRAGGNTVYRYQETALLETTEQPPTSASDEILWTWSRSHGGLANYWTAAVPRFAEQDFTDGARLDERYRWPITYDDVAPYYEIAEKKLVVTAGRRPFANVPANTLRYTVRPPADWAALAEQVEAKGFHLGPLPMAKGAPWMVALRGTEFSSYHCVVAPLLDRPNFRIVANSVATVLHWNPTEAVVDSVSYLDRASRAQCTVRVRAVVLAAGAIDSTAILLRSRSDDFPAGLGNTYGVVGQYLHDHPKQWWPAEPAKRLTALAHPMYLSRGEFGADEPLMASSLTLGLASHRIHSYLRRRTSAFGVQVFGTVVPRPEVAVSLTTDDSATSPAPPRISMRFDDAEQRNMVAARERLQAMFAAAGQRVDVPSDPERLPPGSSIHLGGTVRMHASPEFGAVDATNRLFDARNVVVCDSSCFTTGPEKNPTLTAMAIATRAADLLADDLGAPLATERLRE